MIRINKYLSMCGLTSRRGAEVFIKERRVTINDITLDKLGVIVDEASDVVKVDGVAVVAEVGAASRRLYIKDSIDGEIHRLQGLRVRK